MSGDNEKQFDDLIREALQNARSDRELTEAAFEKMKGALSIQTKDDVQNTMLVGEKSVKLLEQLSRANQQIIQAAQIIERRLARKKEVKRQPFDMASLGKVRLEEEEEIENNEKDDALALK